MVTPSCRRKARGQRKRKKRLSGKEGSPHEEEWLVHAMLDMIPAAKLQGTLCGKGDVGLF